MSYRKNSIFYQFHCSLSISNNLHPPFCDVKMCFRLSLTQSSVLIHDYWKNGRSVWLYSKTLCIVSLVRFLLTWNNGFLNETTSWHQLRRIPCFLRLVLFHFVDMCIYQTIYLVKYDSARKKSITVCHVTLNKSIARAVFWWCLIVCSLHMTKNNYNSFAFWLVASVSQKRKNTETNIYSTNTLFCKISSIFSRFPNRSWAKSFDEFLFVSLHEKHLIFNLGE